jgi:hypothetical protein
MSSDPRTLAQSAARTTYAELGTAVSQRPRETRTWQRLAGRTASFGTGSDLIVDGGTMARAPIDMA